MLFAMICTDRPNALDLRMKARPDHLAYMAELGEQLKFAGPFLDGASKPTGSLVVIEADDLAAAEKIAQNDPYAKAGLFASSRVQAWKWVLNNPDEA